MAERTAYDYSVYESIRDVRLDEWNAVRNPSGDPFMDPRFIEAVETSMGSGSRFRHVIVRDEDGRPIAVACLSSITVDGASLAEGGSKAVLSTIGAVFPRLLRNTIVMCGLPASTGGNHLRIRSGRRQGVGPGDS